MEYVGADWIHLAYNNNNNNNETWWVFANTALKGKFPDQQIVRAASDNRCVTN